MNRGVIILIIVASVVIFAGLSIWGWQNRYGGMKSEEAKRLQQLEQENKQLKEIVAEKELDIRMLKHLTEGNW